MSNGCSNACKLSLIDSISNDSDNREIGSLWLAMLQTI